VFSALFILRLIISLLLPGSHLFPNRQFAISSVTTSFSSSFVFLSFHLFDLLLTPVRPLDDWYSQTPFFYDDELSCPWALKPFFQIQHFIHHGIFCPFPDQVPEDPPPPLDHNQLFMVKHKILNSSFGRLWD